MNRHERRRQAATRTKAAGKVARENNERRMAENKHGTLVLLQGDAYVRFVQGILRREQEQVAAAAALVAEKDGRHPPSSEEP